MFNQEYAVTFPNQRNPLDFYLDFQQNQDRRNYMLLQQQRQDQARRNALMQNFYDKLDFQNYATGTVLDPLINESLKTALSDIYSKQLSGAPESELGFSAADYANRVGAFSNKAKALNANINAQAQALGKENKSIDAVKLGRYALMEALHDFDPNTNAISTKSLLDIPDNYDVNDYLNKRSDLFSLGTQDLDALLKGADKKVYEKESTFDRNGVMTTKAYKGEYYPYNVLVDEKGNEINDATGVATAAKVRSIPFNLPDGQSINLADDNTYAYFTSKPGSNAALNKMVRESGYEPDTKEGDLAKRHLLYNYLDKNNQGFVNNIKNDRKEDSWLAQSRILGGTLSQFGKAISGLGGKDEVQINNLYEGIKGKLKPGQARPMNDFSLDEQSYMVDRAVGVFKPKNEKDKLDQSNLYPSMEADGTIRLRRVVKRNLDKSVTYEDIGVIDPTETNLSTPAKNTGKRAQAVINQKQPSSKPKKDPLGLGL
jgi:hypothetical protein